MELHIQTEEAGLIVMLGSGLTVTSTLSLFWQPLLSVTSTEYIVVFVGLANGLWIWVLFNPVAGNQEYEVPPVAVNSTD